MVQAMRMEVGLKMNAALKDPTPRRRPDHTAKPKQCFRRCVCSPAANLQYSGFLSVGAPIQEMALGKQGGLMYLACEVMVFGSGACEGRCPVPGAVVQSWNAAGQTANGLDAMGAAGGKRMQEVFSKRAKMLHESTARSRWTFAASWPA